MKTQPKALTLRPKDSGVLERVEEARKALESHYKRRMDRAIARSFKLTFSDFACIALEEGLVVILERMKKRGMK